MMEAALQFSFHPEAVQSYDECVALLAHAVEQHDEAKIDEVASLIGQLAIVVEL